MKIHVLGDGITAKAVIDKVNRINGYTIVTLKEADIIVASPGIPPDQYPNTTVPIISEIELSWVILNQMKLSPFIIAVTGTNGKTTVASLISHILDCPAAGNIGTTFISLIPESNQEKNSFHDVIVLELSSYQLYSSPTFKPNVSIITNITEDHLSWHGNMNNYIKSKMNIFKNQHSEDLLIYNSSDKICQEIAENANCKKYGFSANDKEPKINPNENMPGKHNLENALCSYIACREYGMNEIYISQKISEFKGVEHRIELVDYYNGVPIYNDSKATNPDATITAINALGTNGIIILGGKDKNTSLKEMSELIKANNITIILIGEATQRFEQELTKAGIKSIYKEKSLVDATKKAISLSDNNQYIALSPACASFDMYKNFEERGIHFKDIVKEIING